MEGKLEQVTRNDAGHSAETAINLQDAIRDHKPSSLKSDLPIDSANSKLLPQAELAYGAMAAFPALALVKDAVRTSPSKQPLVLVGACGLAVLGSIVTNKTWQDNMQKLTGEVTHGAASILSQIEVPKLRIEIPSWQMVLPTVFLSASEVEPAKADTATNTGTVKDGHGKTESTSKEVPTKCKGGVCEFDPSNAPWLKNRPGKEKLQ